MTAAPAAPQTADDLVRFETDGAVGIARLNRPKVLNALNPELMTVLADQLEIWDAAPEIRAIVIAGSARAFAAGADIGDMASMSAMEMYERDQFTTWDRIERVRTPIVAAVSGFALGGGCELMMLCDIVIASETAQLGQPEINLGVIPGAGGTQRLTRAIGKAKAMDMTLTGRMMDAREAETLGLVSRIVPVEHFESEAISVARTIARNAPIATRFGKQAVNAAFETTLTEGRMRERSMFYMLFASDDQKEGMAAFGEKRRPNFTGR